MSENEYANYNTNTMIPEYVAMIILMVLAVIGVIWVLQDDGNDLY